MPLRFAAFVPGRWSPVPPASLVLAVAFLAGCDSNGLQSNRDTATSTDSGARSGSGRDAATDSTSRVAADGGTATLPSEPGPDGGTRPALDGGVSVERCGNGLDDDGDSEIDENCDCVPESTQRCYAGDPALAGVGICSYGRMRCVQNIEFGIWEACLSSGMPEVEICDGLDNDCDGELDEGCECTPGIESQCYDGPSQSIGIGICRAGTRLCSATPSGSSFGACLEQVLPTTEVCDGTTDEDCDGRVDEGCSCPVGEARDCYPGPIGTSGIGLCRPGRQTCENAGAGSDWGACLGATVPRAEQCGTLGDEDCDGAADCEDPDCNADPACGCPAGAVRECFPADPGLAGVGICTSGQQECYVTASGIRDWSVCIGATPPGTERCDMLDNDCDGQVDEGCECRVDEERRCYTGPARTAGVGSCRTGTQTCLETRVGSQFSGCIGQVVPTNEVCDGQSDEDCDGRIDEGCGCTVGSVRGCYSGPSGSVNQGICRAGSQTCVMLAGGQAGWGACSGEQRPLRESCSGGVDEDCDGRTDCNDIDCRLDRACCTPFVERLAVAPPDADILFVVDRSGSMQWEAEGTTRSRWLEMVDGMSAVLPELDTLRLGLLTFPFRDGTTERNSCSVGRVDVPLALGNGATILSRLSTAPPRAGDTPTPAALMRADAYWDTIASVRPRFVILVTDGLPEPKCDSPPGDTDDPFDRAAMLDDTVAAIRALGIDVFVVGIVGPNRVSGGTDSSIIPVLRNALNEMAIAGGRPRPGTVRYYEANNGSALTRALRTVLGEATDCSFEMSLVPSRPNSLEVYMDDFRVLGGDWSVQGRRLELFGVACDRIQNGLARTLTVRDTCSY